MAYTATTWTDGTTPVNASSMNKIENELSTLDGQLTASSGISAYIKTGNLSANSSISFAYQRTCLIFLLRGNASNYLHIFACDNWSSVVRENDSNTVVGSVTVSDKVATIQNNYGGYINYIVFIC